MAGAVWFLMITAVYRHSGTHRSRNPRSYHPLSSRAKLYDRINDNRLLVKLLAPHAATHDIIHYDRYNRH